MSQLAQQQSQRSAASAAPPILQARGVSKTYRMGESDVEVLRGIDLTVREGEFLAIEGRSGSGKSTLLHILGALDSLDGGRVEFHGADYTSRSNENGREPFLHRLSRWLFRGWLAGIALCFACVIASMIAFHESSLVRKQWSHNLWYAGVIVAAIIALLLLAWIVTLVIRAIKLRIHEAPLTRLRNHDFGFVFQFYHLLPELTVLENAMLPPTIAASTGGNRQQRVARATTVLEELGMGHRLKHRPAQLSGGERQRVAIARALMNQPKVLFADEPTGNLDAETGGQIMAVLEALHRDHKQTIIMVTHDRAIAHQADRVLVLKDGKLAG